jgi:Asp-tRNA(Asn)/Glu-tRNA(Gln) amidotransferase A subunit family amidase
VKVAATRRTGHHPAPAWNGIPHPPATAIGSEDDVDATELCYTPALELGRMIRAREISPVEIAETVLARIERLNPTLNAFLAVTADLARDQARAAEGRATRGELRSPIDGIPVSIKDLEPLAGVRCTYGSKWSENNIASIDGVVAGRLREAGGVILGKTNTPHYGYKDMCDNLLGDPCKNPWNLERTSGASSGGAGSAIAAGLGPLAHGSDGAGSIRIPSALCGIFGIKPAFGRVPYSPGADYWAGRSHAGPMTRTVRDAALLLGVMAGPNERDPLSIDAPPPDFLGACDGDLKGLRVVWSGDLGYAPVDPEVRQIAEAAARRFADFGATVEDEDPAWDDPYEFHKVMYEAASGGRVAERAAERPDWIEATLMLMVENTKQRSAFDLQRSFFQRTAFFEQARAWFENVDLLLTPQMPVGAWSHRAGIDEGPADIGGRKPRSMFDRLHFTYPFNLTNQPAATVPCGFTSEGLPVGLQIVGKWHDEATVFRAAACFEAAQPWAQHRPPLN